MATLNNSVQPGSPYNPRYFIWTIVFLVSVGVMLVTYMFQTSLEDSVEASAAGVSVHYMAKK